jgi:hypothetical protein
MLPASDLAEILTNLSALNLQPNITAAVLGAVLTPLIRSANPQQLVRPRRYAARPQANPRNAVPRKKPKQRTAPAGEPTDSPRQRAARALAANPNVSLTKVAAIAGVSRSTVCNAARELAAKARKQARREARKQAGKSLKPETIEHRARAQRFLKDTLAGGPKRASDVEEAADRAHIDAGALAAARTELGVVTSRGNAGGVQAVQWSLPAP